MSYEQHTLKNPSSLRRFSHRSRFALALRLLDPQPGDRILDYGTGDGELLVQLAASQTGLSLAAFEPVAWCLAEAMQKTGGLQPPARVTSDFARLADFKPNKVACLEVLEHLGEPQLSEALDRLSSLARQGATILVSVPIEVGPPALLRYLVRIRTDASQRRPWADVWKSVFGRTGHIERPAHDQYILHHFGFDFRQMPERARRHGLEVKRQVYSPLPGLGRLVNSQVFYFLGAVASDSTPAR